MRRLSLFVLAALALACRAHAADKAACADAVAQAEHEARLPAHILPTLAVVESGRPIDGHVRAWPWTVDVDGKGFFYDTKAEAITAVRGFRMAGARSIDVGCMQINLQKHPGAFASLDDAFDPAANARYGATFLRALYAASGQWGAAITAYHSTTPSFAANYARKVLAIWPGAAVYGLVATNIAGAAASPVAARERHDYTAAFARRVAADMAAWRARVVRKGVAPPRGSRLQVASVSQRHGSAWPRGVP